MLTNDQMKANRFYRWYKARKMISAIKKHLAEGRTVYVSTMTKATKYSAKHIDMFKASRSGAYVQSGNKWLCIDFCKVSVYE